MVDNSTVGLFYDLLYVFVNKYFITSVQSWHKHVADNNEMVYYSEPCHQMMALFFIDIKG